MADSEEKLERISHQLSRRTLLRGIGLLSIGASACDPAAEGGDAGAPFDGGRRVDAGPDPVRERTFEVFEHGVASGDPHSDSVVLWTRITPARPSDEAPSEVDVGWEVAADEAFTSLVGEGTFQTDPSRDYTVKVVVDGLSAGTRYHYRFVALGETSPVGRTKTAPSLSATSLRLAFCSCASLGHGFFHAYARIAERDDLDAVLHLGDYIYEYGDGTYGTRRLYDPPHEVVSLDDYRRRYAQYRREPELAAAHASHPFIAVWDDHESADNAYRDGALNHNPGEGLWPDRLAAARQAYFEWLPIRENAERTVQRSFQFADLVDLTMLDTRIAGRMRQGDMPEQLLGEEQEAWLFDQLQRSTARWRLIGQQVPMGHMRGLPNSDVWNGYPAARRRLFDHIERNDIDNVVVLTGDIHSSWAMDLTHNPEDSGYDPETGAGSLAVEFITPAISSPGFLGPLGAAVPRIVEDNRHIHYGEGQRRGYVALEITPESIRAEYYHIDDVEDPDAGEQELAASFLVESGHNHVKPS